MGEVGAFQQKKFDCLAKNFCPRGGWTCVVTVGRLGRAGVRVYFATDFLSQKRFKTHTPLL
jgi:hypothetical protein